MKQPAVGGASPFPPRISVDGITTVRQRYGLRCVRYLVNRKAKVPPKPIVRVGCSINCDPRRMRADLLQPTLCVHPVEH